MTPATLAIELEKNRKIILEIFKDVSVPQLFFQPSSDSWSMLFIICHLRDEEVEDFRARTEFILQHPEMVPPPFDPTKWVTDRKYADQNCQQVLEDFNRERLKSIDYLKVNMDLDTSKGFDHARYGRYTVQLVLDNWLAHDLLHIRQLTRLRYQYLNATSSNSLDYAGKW